MGSPRVAVFVDMLSAYGREVLIGINRYTRTHGPWVIYGDPERIVAPISEVGKWGGDGVIAHVYQPRMRRQLQRMGLPVVNVSQYLGESVFPSVLPDNAAVGRLAAEHLLERGFRHFAYCGFRRHRYGELRGEAFARRVIEAGYASERFDTDPPQERPEQWEARQAELAAWVGSLPRPVGVFCCNDARARHVAQVCHRAGVRVPEELALVGADDDELVCEMSNPPLSSVDVSAEQVGYEAAALLGRMMAGASAPSPDSPMLLAPAGVVTRRSSDVLAIDDAAVVASMRFIRDHASEPINVEDVLGVAHVSRRVLERRFRAMLGRTVGQEIANVRLDRAKGLLIDSDLPAPDVAERCGYTYVQQFNAMFKRRTGMTPTAWRRQFRVR